MKDADSDDIKPRRVAVIGSTGGGTATLGHTDPPALLRIIHQELCKLEGCEGVSTALIVALEGGKGFDNVNEESDKASLYQVSSPSLSSKQQQDPLVCCKIATGTVKQVNERCQKLSQDGLARDIASGQIHGLICISVSVKVFEETLQAAAKADIPVTGTGGTSLSLASSLFRIRLVGNAGGSVANTSLTRAVSYTHALATDWKIPYRPWKTQNSSGRSDGPRWKSILNSCLPAFWGVCLLRRFSSSVGPLLNAYLGDANHGNSFLLAEEFHLLLSFLEQHALPTACAVVTASSSSLSNQGNDPSPSSTIDTSSRIMASVLASTAASRSILGGFVAGHLVALWQERVVFWCVIHNVPATMTNLMATGGVGATIAMLLFPINPFLQQITNWIRHAIQLSVSTTMIPPPLGIVGALLWGCLCCYGSKVGWYHAIFLPLILIEMELGDASFLGAIDELTLVLVCAGICTGSLVSAQVWPKKDLLTDADISLCWRAVRINILYGDFVEACYVFMQQHWLVNMGGYIGSGLSSAILVALQTAPDDDGVNGRSSLLPPQSLAYLPWPVALWLSGKNWWPMLMASIAAFGIPFGATILNNMLHVKKPER